MARSADPLRRDTIERQAQGVGASIEASQSNPALSLGRALAAIQPTAGVALQNYADKQNKEATARAHKDALEASGAKLADAVRDGKLEPTSNPWYVQAYKRESAAIRGQTALSQLQQESTTWAESNDPEAFAKRWREEVGKLAANFDGPDEVAGFAPVEAQYSQQTLQGNESKNVTRIVAERDQNTSILAADALVQRVTVGGGKITANEAYNALLPSKQRYLATGGSEASWNKLVVEAASTAESQLSMPGFARDLLQQPELLSGPSEAGDGASIGGGTEVSSTGSGFNIVGSPIPQPDGTASAPTSERVVNKGGRTWVYGEGAPVAGAAAIVKALVPGVVITDKGRSASSPMGRKNPGSDHVKFPDSTVDVAPVPGMTFAQFTQTFRDKGYTLIQAFEEVGAGRSKFATGDHWHLVLGKATAPPPAVEPAAPGGAGNLGGIVDAAVAGADPQSVPPADGTTTGSYSTKDQPVAPPVAVSRGASLYDMAGVSDQVETLAYRTQQRVDAAQGARLQALTIKDRSEGKDAYDQLYGAYGYRLLDGSVSSAQLASDMQKAGVRPQAAAEALRLVRGDLADNAGVGAARMALKNSDPSNARELLDLSVEGITSGITPSYMARVQSKVLSGEISADDGVGMISRAQSRTDQLKAQTRSDLTFDQSQEDRRDYKKEAQALKRFTSATLPGITGLLMYNLNIRRVRSKPADIVAIKAQITSAAQAYLATHDGDYAGAEVAARNAAASILSAIAAKANLRGGGAAKQPASAGANPLRTS